MKTSGNISFSEVLLAQQL